MANVSSFSGAMPVIPGGTVEVARLTATGANGGVSIVQNFASASNLFSSSATVVADGSTSFLVEIYVPLIYALGAGFQGRVSLVNGTSEYGRLITIDTAGAFEGSAQYGQMVITPAAGTLTLNARIFRNNANTGNAYYGDGATSNYAPATLRVSKIVNQNDGLKPFWTPPVVTQLPSQATVGDQVIYAADATNGVYWTLYYDGIGTYPWKFIGGSPLSALGSGTSSSSASYINTGTASLTIPRAGDYVLSYGGLCQSLAAGLTAQLIQPHKNGVSISAEAQLQSIGTTTYDGASVWGDYRENGIAAGAVIDLRYLSTSGISSQYIKLKLLARPVRVAA